MTLPLSKDELQLAADFHGVHIAGDIYGKGMLIPATWHGSASLMPSKWTFLDWIKNIPGRTYCYLFAATPGYQNFQLPEDYDTYVISYHLEAVEWFWIKDQAKKLDKPIVILYDGEHYDYPLPPNVIYGRMVSWHWQIELIKKWFPDSRPREPKYKASGMCHRISQSKLIIVTALLEYLDSRDILVSISTWLEPKNVHYWQPNNVQLLDDLTDIFRQKYLGKTLSFDDFDGRRDNYQRFTSNPWPDFLTKVALHFTNESFHYSLMFEGNDCNIIPGPFLTEKTLRCLPGGTPFIPVGQFDTYGALGRLGLNFDYKFDTSWDKDPGNLSRLVSIVDLIHSFKHMTAADIYDCAKEATLHNSDMIWSGEFSKNCNLVNRRSIEDILVKLAKI